MRHITILKEQHVKFTFLEYRKSKPLCKAHPTVWMQLHLWKKKNPTAYIFLATYTNILSKNKIKPAPYTFHFAVKGISSIISRRLGICFLKIFLRTFNAVVNPLYRVLLKKEKKQTNKKTFTSAIGSKLSNCSQRWNSRCNALIIIISITFWTQLKVVFW